MSLRGCDTGLETLSNAIFQTVVLLMSPSFNIFLHQNRFRYPSCFGLSRTSTLSQTFDITYTFVSVMCCSHISQKVSETEENEDKVYYIGMGKAEGNTIFPRSTGRREEQCVCLSQSNTHRLKRKRPFTLLSIIVKCGPEQKGK